jgi:hypothetical protein
LSRAYLDAEIDRRRLARCAMLGAGPAPARPSSQARINMNRALSRLATRAAYGASQLPRIACIWVKASP